MQHVALQPIFALILSNRPYLDRLDILFMEESKDLPNFTNLLALLHLNPSFLDL